MLSSHYSQGVQVAPPEHARIWRANPIAMTSRFARVGQRQGPYVRLPGVAFRRRPASQGSTCAETMCEFKTARKSRRSRRLVQSMSPAKVMAPDLIPFECRPVDAAR